MSQRKELASARRWIIKIGSSMITAEGRGLDAAHLDAWVTQIAGLRRAGHQVVLVSSGAVAEGMVRLGWSRRPDHVHDLQAAAAVGQMGLIQAWESRFRKHDMHTAQVLLTHEDVRDRRRYLNARSTLLTLLGLDVIPVVNENDTVATEEIRLGDNDTLAALTANLIEADVLVILTDQDGMYEQDPRSHPDARLIEEAQADDSELKAMAGGGSGSLGRGGMRTKLTAAEWAARSGAHTIIANGGADNVLLRLAGGEALGTWLKPGKPPLGARKRWIAGLSRPNGQLTLDAGAVKAVRQGGRSLLPVGVTAVQGDFQRGDLVTCLDEQGREVARGLVNYAARDAERLSGQTSDRIAEILGYVGDQELIHRDNLVVS